MKKYLFILLIVLTQSVRGQVTLEATYPNTIGSTKFLMLVQLDSAIYKYVLFDHLNSQFTIYNLNHSVYLSVSIPITYTQGVSQYTIAYVSRSLFDCDTSTIEYALSFTGDGAPNSYPKQFYVYRTNGTQLVNIDSCCFMNYSNGWQYGPLYNEPIVNTPGGSKLFLRCLDGSTRIYSVCGRVPNQIQEFENEFGLGNPFPNPTKDQITIPYSLPEGESNGTLNVYDLMGTVVRSSNVDSSFNSITLSTSELASGTYYYQLNTSKGDGEAKTIIKIE